MEEQGRVWLPDPTGRHSYRAKTNGVWTDRVSDTPDGAGDLRDGEGAIAARAAEKQTATATAAETPAKQAGGVGTGCAVLIGLTVLLSLVVWGCGELFGEDEVMGSYRTASVKFEPENPASLRVFVELENTGDTPISPECTVRASDPSGAYSGFDVFEMTDVIAPGDVGGFQGVLVVRNEGAAFVDDVTVECD